MSSRFGSRSCKKEMMDNLEAGGDQMRRTLSELETINSWLGGNRTSINAIKQLIDPDVDKTWEIIDIGCGRGGILKIIAKWARRNSLKVVLVGIDANPNVIQLAKENCQDFPEIIFLTMNILSTEFKKLNCDILIATLFLHHFSDEELVQLLRQFKSQASVGIAINDLHRHWLAYYSIKILTTLLSKSLMVKNDGEISVLRAFTRAELQRILNEAQIDTISFKWKWAFRWQVVALTH